jgi:hypothetical protein
MRLLSNGDTNTKLAKSNRKSNYLTYGLSLAPADASGYQTCSSLSVGCKNACIFKAGLAGVFRSIPKARIAKTQLLFENRPEFETRLRSDIRAAVRKAEKLGKRLAIRLNVFSDIQWERIMPWIFAEFPAVQFYDYSKHYLRMLRFCSGSFPQNYHLTFSRSEANERKSVKVLMSGGNVAVVFAGNHASVKAIPLWHGFGVYDGDQTDLRFLERGLQSHLGRVVKLYAKGSAGKADRTGFVVHPTDATQPLLSTF